MQGTTNISPLSGISQNWPDKAVLKVKDIFTTTWQVYSDYGVRDEKIFFWQKSLYLLNQKIWYSKIKFQELFSIVGFFQNFPVLSLLSSHQVWQTEFLNSLHTLNKRNQVQPCELYYLSAQLVREVKSVLIMSL